MIYQWLKCSSMGYFCYRDFYTDSLVAMAFKIIYDQRHGLLLFVRVYSGTLKAGMKIYNPNKAC